MKYAIQRPLMDGFIRFELTEEELDEIYNIIYQQKVEKVLLKYLKEHEIGKGARITSYVLTQYPCILTMLYDEYESQKNAHKSVNETICDLVTTFEYNMINSSFFTNLMNYYKPICNKTEMEADCDKRICCKFSSYEEEKQDRIREAENLLYHHEAKICSCYDPGCYKSTCLASYYIDNTYDLAVFLQLIKIEN